MLRSVDVAHLIVRSRLQPGAIAIDATVGNGFDTIMLADAVGVDGVVFGFDIQERALSSARARLGARQNVTLFHAGHEHMSEQVPPEVRGQTAAIMFNLGYLPGADKQIVTRIETTVPAVTQAISLLAPQGLLTAVIYPGHPGGAEEAAAAKSVLAALSSDFATHHLGRLASAKSAPELLVVEKLR